MIKLTRLDGAPIYVNEDYIETVDVSPDATINLHNGTTYVVKESPEKIMDMIDGKCKKYGKR
jgi:flagellar protein FlbD